MVAFGDVTSLSLHGAPARYPDGLQDVGGGAWAWLQPNGGLGESNAGLVVGAGESLLIDTLWDLALTGRMLGAMATLTAQAPIRRLVNTHADGDHCWGNQLLANAEIIGTRACQEDMLREDPRALRLLRRAGGVGPLVERAPRALPGVDQTAGLASFASLLAPFNFNRIELTPPTRTFQAALELDVGGRQVEVIEVGPAHTPGDAIVHVPDARAVFAADVLFVGVAPIMWVGPVERWLAALERIVELDPVTVVPGHGPVSDLAGVRTMREYWCFVAPAVRERIGAGMTAEAAAREIIATPQYKRQPFGRWDAAERLVVSAETIARNDRGETGRLGDVARVRLLAAMGRLANERKGT
jgi:glyoxylase-like metal-dependent hydrolase (beta-lactamase superfamily II)